MLDAALFYAESGIPVIPIHGIRHDGACTCGKETCSSPGKHPRTQNGLNDATTDVATIRRWWSRRQWPHASIAGVCGNHLVLDVDVKNGGDRSLERLIQDNAPLPETGISETGVHKGNRGKHYWFSVPKDQRGTVGSKTGVRQGIDIRCARGYALLPPSPHASGVTYEWLTEFDEITEAPGWLLELAPLAVAGESTWVPDEHFRMSREVRSFLVGTHTISPGEQRDFLTRAARSVLTTGKSVDDAAMLLFEGEEGDGGICACEASRDPWTFEDILYLVEDVYRKPPTSELYTDFTAEEYTWDDYGNAQRLVSSYPDNALRHVHEWGKWYIWDAGLRSWTEDDGSAIRRKWDTVTKKLWDQSINSDDKNWTRFISGCRNRARTENASYFARDIVRVKPDELNADPFLLNCHNGVLNLRTGELLEPDPSYLLTKCVRANYVAGAKHPLWEKVLQDLIPNAGLRIFLQKVFGYTLTGSTAEHKFFYLHGPPGSGKTTLLESFSWLMNNYSESCEPATFMVNRQEGGPTEDIARLSNARMVTTHEVEEGARWAEARVAHLTGGDKVTARFLHQNSFEFYPKFKLFFCANHKPRVSGSAQSGLWRRLIIIPVDRVIPEEERDPMLQLKLREPEVLSAILAWAVEGCKMWSEENSAGKLMEVPDLVKEEVAEYKQEENHVLQFMSEVLVKTDVHSDRIPKPDLYQMYRGWCESTGRRQYHTTHRLTKELTSEGLTSRAASIEGRVRDCWIGVKTVKGLPSLKH
jgi:putative DNA primase/helicase